ncbi:CPBP family intramembrane glutamic endopeptidase [Lentisalinibacter sediminis]|uniref:CPBP family intramembrane glutamic endopeptidase n=1 Tax=Lentisalinibacter sediminis TaxID=2992237 RepID=UPI003864E972
MRFSRHRAATLMHPLDHLYLLLLVVGLPLYSAWSWRRWLTKLAAGQRPRRLRLYLGSLAQLWLVFGVLAACWWWLGRSPAPLGFTAPGGTGFWLGAVLVALATGVFLQSWRGMARADAADRRRYREQLAELGHMMPRDGREYGAFVALSITAGVVEETLFRGWLIWYLQAWMPLTAAVLVSSLLFGLAHVYQGPAGIAKTGVMGLLLALLYLLSGSLWLPIVAHAMVDVLQGATMMELYRRPSADDDDDRGDGDDHEPPAATIPR